MSLYGFPRTEGTYPTIMPMATARLSEPSVLFEAHESELEMVG